MSSLFKPCTTTAGDWCQKVVSGQSISPYLITLNSHDHLILAGQSSGGGLVLAEYTPNGQTVWVHELAAGVVDSAQGLTTDVNDNIFISGALYGGLTDLGHPLIAKLTPEGQLLWSRDPGGLFGTAGLAADANGNAVLVTGSNEVLKYSPSGDLLWRLTPKDKTGVSQPSVDAAGNILALTTDASSAFLTEWSASGEPISDEKLYPVGGSPPSLAFDPNGDLCLWAMTASP